MKHTVTLPAHLLPESVSPPLVASVERWEKSLGQAVMLGDALVTLRAGDALFVVPSPAFGVLTKKCVLAGEAIEAGEPVAVLGGVSAPLSESVPEPFAAPPLYIPAGPEDIYTLSPLELALGEHHTRSLRDTPHAYTVATADVSEALRYLAKTGRGETVSGVPERLTLLPFVLCATAAGLTRFPEVNAQQTGDAEVRRKRYVHLGVETRREGGALAVPVLRDVDRKSVLTIAREWDRLQARIAGETLGEDDISGATFTVSHSPNVLYRMPILHHPLAGHLCFGKTVDSQVYFCLAYNAAIVSVDAAETFLSDVTDGISEARFLFA
ncbi:MAG: 2-oxo acid dehydrogenase subunit E2 [Akkermansiaceae bacterium]|nr:2-oxo acid dehydrogenase subunit E2 [Armatimonadota bacterium]